LKAGIGAIIAIAKPSLWRKPAVRPKAQREPMGQMVPLPPCVRTVQRQATQPKQARSF
jgi:hypothetical protein